MGAMCARIMPLASRYSIEPLFVRKMLETHLCITRTSIVGAWLSRCASLKITRLWRGRVLTHIETFSGRSAQQCPDRCAGITLPYNVAMLPDDPIERHFRFAPAQHVALRRLKLATIRDLLYHFPSRYEAAGASGEAARLVPGAKVTLVGSLSKLKARKLWKSRRNVTEGWFEDSSGRVKVMWFNQPYIASYLPHTGMVKMSGVVGGSAERPYIANPEVEAIPAGAIPKEGMFKNNDAKPPEITSDARRREGGAGDVLNNTATETPGTRNEAGGVIPGGLFPVYPESKGLTSRWFYHALERIFASDALKRLEDPLPSDVRNRYRLPDLARSLLAMHRPKNQRETEAARKRFAFEEILVLQITRAKERAENDAQVSFPITEGSAHAERFLETIPYPPTKAQKRAVADIFGDFTKSHPMARLLEGDVGSGKTLVAAATAYGVVNSRPPNRTSGTLQVAYMAPTEILAGQHFQSFIEYFSHLPIAIGLLTGKICKKFPSKIGRGKTTNISRSQLLKWVANGEIAMIVGTHALIQKSVAFQHLAYVIVDEQHRFGTNQRKALVRRSTQIKQKTLINADVTNDFLFKDLSYAIRNCSFTVHNELGSGHKESVYQNALEEEFRRRNIKYSREIQIPVTYRGKKIGVYQPDFLVENKVIVELKALPRLGAGEKKQLWNYLKGTAYTLALLLNFGNNKMETERIVFDSARTSNLRVSATAKGDDLRSSAQKMSIPHFLSMTATPIPRTLALTMYGDLDISLLDELPPGRAKVTTVIVKPSERDIAYETIRRELSKGRQAYVICPRIEEPDPKKWNTLQAKSAKAEAKRLKKEVFPEFEIGLLHGAMPAKGRSSSGGTPNKESVMKEFADGKISILVATSVVEVGVNVPNATVMLIEGAERFGLAQLHQLRGRIQRSIHPPHCFLLPEAAGETAMKRLRALEKSNDGFKLAEADLEARGAGDLYGRSQWGVSDLGMEALKNVALIRAAREEAGRLIREDPLLVRHPILSERVGRVSSEMHNE